ncbi:MBL fold metallo-hydrolase [Saccharothrix variisporea]|uniref:Glyoxylase-like metal-dependent hydrolase (Beta-lactamase superfamily II) n=1 Tax=Saccharothrix variisporea TaxID=543527 RepID=A0A495X6D6_9PSEU|nr:MBL fold metallo-hydrolase [Saccharothrix variisporea]RKT69116.1 glyoxylase-like metal-dependent hydrolase (beta-lactamase superfamily II) [Saccharothrix variisporea]
MIGAPIVPLVDQGLGNSAYLVDLGDGRALAVDVSRDLRAVDREAARRGLVVAFAADTHLHADFLSGARQLAATRGARVLASAAGAREFDHEGLHDGDEVDLGGLTLRALATPGHTHEHLSLLLSDGSRPLGVFTGGSLLVGSAARTDLVAPDRTEELARAQHASLRRLATLPDEVAVWPTHGGGSFCAAPAGGDRVSTIGREKATNPLLGVADEDEFVAALLGPLGSYPTYFRWLGETNRRGPAVLPDSPALPALTAAQVPALLADGGQVVDVRPLARFAAAHVPGSLSIPLRPVFASWLGWLAPPDRPLVVVRDPDQDPAEVLWQALKIGYDDLAGEIVLDEWVAADQPTTATRLVSAREVEGVRVLDVRQRAEYASGHLPGADHVELGDLPARAADLPDEPTVVMCGHGERALGAASLLERAGLRDVSVLTGGPHDWAEQTGGTLATGS